jgi:hypothetical protein
MVLKGLIKSITVNLMILNIPILKQLLLQTLFIVGLNKTGMKTNNIFLDNTAARSMRPNPMMTANPTLIVNMNQNLKMKLLHLRRLLLRPRMLRRRRLSLMMKKKPPKSPRVRKLRNPRLRKLRKLIPRNLTRNL